MLSRVFSLAAILLLALCLGTVALWFTSRATVNYFSYTWEAEPGYPGKLRSLALTTGPDRFAFFASSDANINNLRGFAHSQAKPYGFRPRGRSWTVGPVIAAADDRPPSSQLSLYFQNWALTGLLAVVPAMWLLRRLLRLCSQPAGFCRKCGYDMRATPERCPECGTTPTPAAAALHNQPMQWTEPAGNFLMNRAPARRRLGR
jgi:hypothetical protein